MVRGEEVPGPFRRAEVDRVRFGICPALRLSRWIDGDGELRPPGCVARLPRCTSEQVDFRLSSPRDRRFGAAAYDPSARR